MSHKHEGKAMSESIAERLRKDADDMEAYAGPTLGVVVQESVALEREAASEIITLQAKLREGVGLELDTPVGRIQLVGEPLVVSFVQELIGKSFTDAAKDGT